MFFSETLCNFAVELPNKHYMAPKIGDRMKLSPHIASGILLACVIALALISCGRAPEYPSLLLAADRSIMKGNYDDADSLLALYDQSVSNTHADAARFRQLLALERMFVSEKLTESDFSLADSLCRFYEEHDLKSEYSKALCVLGEIYRQNGDYPSALDAFLKAGKLAEECGDSYELCWVYQKRGDIFFDQKMYDESVDSYQEYYHIASLNRDTLRMALAAFRMGEIYTYQSDVDSTIYYYSQALDFGGHTRHPENIVPYSRNALCDIYIQIEEYDKALEFLSRDSTDDANWAYWHLGQEHIDSAIWYFKRIDGRYGVYGQSETLHHLALLEESKGNTQEAMYYYKQRDAIYDSIRVLSQVEATQKVNAQYNLNLIKKERDEIAQKKREAWFWFGALLAFGLMAGAFAFWLYKNSQNEKRRLADRIQLLRGYAVNKNLYDSPVANHFRQLLKANPYHQPEAKDWKELTALIETEIPGFRKALSNEAYTPSDIEYDVCMLIKIQIPLSDIARLKHCVPSYITQIRKNVYKNLFSKKGSANELDEYIMQLC